MVAQRRQLNMFTKGRIVEMLETSRSQTEVSRILNVDQSVISRLWKRFQRTEDVTRQPMIRTIFHRAVLIDDSLETENIQSMSWPANSPDLQPIEHVWDMIGRQFSAHSHPPSSIAELKRSLQEAWNRLRPQLIHHLIATGILAKFSFLSNCYFG
ncbi:transposable element Tc3 transposase [Trichonephila clavipes]|nr:transposable element Tc3 transposase [Trichonephila clavipes]